MKIKSSFGDRVLSSICYLIVILVCIVVIVPFWNIFVQSITPKSDMNLNFKWFPGTVSWDAWRIVLESAYMWLCFKNTVLRVIVSTIISLLLTVTYTYPLIREGYPLKKFCTTLVLITMFFNGGLIPTYLNMADLGLIDSFLSLVLPGALGAFNVILLKNFFKQLPAGLIEAAEIDGANDILILFKIVVPLSLPILATIVLWHAVGTWNEWFNCLLYIKDRDRYVLQIMIRELQADVAAITAGEPGANTDVAPPSEALIAACNLFAIIPIMCIYPFAQKYFVGGITLGAVKG